MFRINDLKVCIVQDDPEKIQNRQVLGIFSEIF